MFNSGDPTISLGPVPGLHHSCGKEFFSLCATRISCAAMCPFCPLQQGTKQGVLRQDIPVHFWEEVGNHLWSSGYLQLGLLWDVSSPGWWSLHLSSVSQVLQPHEPFPWPRTDLSPICQQAMFTSTPDIYTGTAAALRRQMLFWWYFSAHMAVLLSVLTRVVPCNGAVARVLSHGRLKEGTGWARMRKRCCLPCSVKQWECGQSRTLWSAGDSSLDSG